MRLEDTERPHHSPLSKRWGVEGGRPVMQPSICPLIFCWWKLLLSLVLGNRLDRPVLIFLEHQSHKPTNAESV